MFSQEQIVEKGIIKYIRGNRATVEIIKPDSNKCKSCGVCMGIENTGNLLEVDTIPQVSVGQQVTLQITGYSPYKSILLLFILPIVSLLIGSFAGQKIDFICPNSQDMRMIGCGFIFFLFYIVSLGIYDKKLRVKKYAYRKIISIDTIHNST